MQPNFNYERRLWMRGLQIIGGADEVGRGSFAGPVVVAICGFSSEVDLPKEVVIRDSKILTQNEREMAYNWLIHKSYFWAVGSATVTQINRKGIKKATDIAFRKAAVTVIKSVGRIDHLLIDAFYIPYLAGVSKNFQTPITKGDRLSISIAAASIIAKVERDKIMVKLGKSAENKKYGWIENKGYGTKLHRDAILKYGISRHHRQQFVQTFLENQNKS